MLCKPSVLSPRNIRRWKVCDAPTVAIEAPWLVNGGHGASLCLERLTISPWAPLGQAVGVWHGKLRVRGEMLGWPRCRNVGESQPVLMMIHPMIISPRTRS
jgi:hypothetical protein